MLMGSRAGVTFGVELYVPWDAPEMAVDLSSTGYCASTKCSGCFRDEWSLRQGDRESHSAREGRP